MIRTPLIPSSALLIAMTTVVGFTSMLTTGCQDVSESKVVLTQQQWQEVEKHILKEAPSPQHKLNVNYDNEIELLGFDVEPKILKSGEKATFTWYWKALKTPTKNWEIFIHLDSKDEALRQGLDHHPVNGLFKTSLWKKDQFIKDVQTVTIREDFPAGIAIPYIGLYNGKGLESRKLIVNDAEKTNDRRAVGPELTVVKGTAGATNAEPAPQKPSYNPLKLSEEQAASIVLDGKIDEAFWTNIKPIEIAPFGDGQSLKTWAKIAHTNEALYVVAHLEDNHIWGDLDKRDDKTWEQEVFELFIDTNGDSKDYLELQITPKNVIFDANFKERLGAGEGTNEEQIARASAWNYEGMESAVHVEGTLNDAEKPDTFWSVELKLPFANFPGAEGKVPADGTAWSMNLYRFDRPTPKQSFAYAWSRLTRNSFHDVPMFGTLRFGPSIDRNALKRLQSKGAIIPNLHNLNRDGKDKKSNIFNISPRNDNTIDRKSLRKALKARQLNNPDKTTAPPTTTP